MPERIITGQIIRILDSETVIVNLGSKDGITDSAIFCILGKPENVLDPKTNEVLGIVTLVKAKVKASRIYEKFTIAVSRWTENSLRWFPDFALIRGEQQQVGVRQLNVKPEDVQPWASQSEEKIVVGDTVEATVNLPEAQKKQKDTLGAYQNLPDKIRTAEPKDDKAQQGS